METAASTCGMAGGDPSKLGRDERDAPQKQRHGGGSIFFRMRSLAEREVREVRTACGKAAHG